jgi:hypothetical protein
MRHIVVCLFDNMDPLVYGPYDQRHLSSGADSARERADKKFGKDRHYQGAVVRPLCLPEGV